MEGALRLGPHVVEGVTAPLGLCVRVLVLFMNILPL